jgi:HAE1 family hydrophobic/amphiphilic exporter-1
MELEDRGGVGAVALQQMVDEMVRDGNTQTGLRALNSTYRAAVPQLFIDVDARRPSLSACGQRRVRNPADVLGSF